MYIYNPNTWQVEAIVSGQEFKEILSYMVKFEAGLEYRAPCVSSPQREEDGRG